MIIPHIRIMCITQTDGDEKICNSIDTDNRQQTDNRHRHRHTHIKLG